MKLAIAAATAAAVAALTYGAQAEELRIGYINTLNHPVGKEQVNGFKAGLAAVKGGRALALRVGAGLGASIAAGAAGLAVTLAIS